jgi:hypothetical protein
MQFNRQPLCLHTLLLFGLLLMSALLPAQAQSWKRVWIENSGCSVQMPEAEVSTESGLDVDSNKLYITRATLQLQGVEYLFYVAVMQLHPETDSEDDMERLVAFSEYVKSTQMVVQAAGSKPVNSLLRGKIAKGITDHWSDHTGNDYAVTGWSKGRTLALLFVAGEKPYPSTSQLNSFFNSFQFPSLY